jgi:hypothetical protein
MTCSAHPEGVSNPIRTGSRARVPPTHPARAGAFPAAPAHPTQTSSASQWPPCRVLSFHWQGFRTAVFLAEPPPDKLPKVGAVDNAHQVTWWRIQRPCIHRDKG